METSLVSYDVVRASLGYTLGAYLEDLVLTGSENISGTGNSLNNKLTGNGGNNFLGGDLGYDTLIGGMGEDTLDGGAGYDSMSGGLGNDTYYVDKSGDTITESNDSVSGGIDTVISTATHYTLGSYQERLTLSGTAAIDGTGNSLANKLTGNSGANVLDGKAGADSMSGGLGNDTYYLDNAGDSVTESSDSVNGGIDTVISMVSRTLGSYQENLTLWAGTDATGNSLNNYLTGNEAENNLNGGSGNDTLDGGAGFDILTGGQGDDCYFVDNDGEQVVEAAGAGTDTVKASSTYGLLSNLENLVLIGSGNIDGIGNSLDNNLTGNAGNNHLDGSLGADTLAGGLGNDTYIVDNAGDTVIEATGAGRDLVMASISYTLGVGLEDLAFGGSSNLRGTGNALDNNLLGNTGNNILDGGVGTDSLQGGLGNDTYVIDTSADVIYENANEGTDTVVTLFSGYTLGANIENGLISSPATASITGNSLSNLLYAGSGNNIISGGAGSEADTVSYATANSAVKVNLALTTAQTTYGSGSDTLVRIENLTGSAYNDTLIGSAGSNILDGDNGADSMAGGAGDDAYYVHNTGDIVTEAAGAGTDIVYSYLTHSSGQTYTLTSNVENGRILTSAASNLTGNSASNTLYAGAGNNRLSGGAGSEADTVSYAYASSAVKVSLAVTSGQATGGSGTDTLVNIENLTGSNYNDTLTGSAGNNSLKGGSGNDSLSGGDGADRLIGGAGQDTLVGGNGSDIFDFNGLSEMGLGSSTCDVISGFVRGQDKIDLSTLDANTATTTNNAFSGTLIASGAKFTAAGQLKLVNGVLYGNTDADATAEFAIKLTGITALSAADFVL